MENQSKSIRELAKEIVDFRHERNWEQFHSIDNLLLGLNIECAELQEIFLWKLQDHRKNEKANEETKTAISDELADIFIFLSYISHHFDINLQEAIEQKLAKTRAKYPVDKSYGKNLKYNEL